MPLEATEPFPTPAEFVEMLGRFLNAEEAARARDGLRLDQVAVDLPFEITVEDRADGSLRIGTSPPTQLVETSVMPVWNRIRLVIGALEDGDG